MMLNEANSAILPAAIKPVTDTRRGGRDAFAVRFKTEVFDKLGLELGRYLILCGARLQHRQKRSYQALVFVARSIRANTDWIPLTQDCVQFGRTLPYLSFTKGHR